jgi:hypothetical protein
VHAVPRQRPVAPGAAHLQGKAEEGIHGQRAFLGDGAGMPRSGASVNPKPVAPSARGR